MAPQSLFAVGALRGVALAEDELPRLQRFLEANPEYYLAVNGSPPGPEEARGEFAPALPDGWRFDRHWLIGFEDEHGTLVGMANVTEGMLAEHVWHVGLFIVATALHGRGIAMKLHSALEEWMRERGARWTRLGVVVGNARAERFWEKAGYVEMRRREGIAMGARVNDLRVMAKPLAGGSREEYLALLPRDRPPGP